MFNLERLASFIFPWFWYQWESTRHFVNLLINSLSAVNDNTVLLFQDIRQRVKVSPQRLSLELSLNDRFDSTLNRIVVRGNNTARFDFVFNSQEAVTGSIQIYVFNLSETIPVGARQRYVLNDNEPIELLEANIIAPVALQPREQELRAWVGSVSIFSHAYRLTFI